MKAWGHLVWFFSVVFAIDALVVHLLLAIYSPASGLQQPVLLELTVSALVFGIVVTNGPGSVLLRRFYDHHQEHADDLARWLKGLTVKFEPNTAVDTLHVEAKALNPDSHASKPPVTSQEVLKWLRGHIAKGRNYRGFKPSFTDLVEAHHEYERLFKEARKAIRASVATEVDRMWPEFPKGQGGPGPYFNLDETVEGTWDVLFVRAKKPGAMTPRVEVEKSGGAPPQIALRLRGGDYEMRERWLGQFDAVDSLQEDVNSMIIAQTGMAEHVRLAESVAKALVDLQTKFDAALAAREMTAWRIARNRDVGGKCDDCPRFWG